MHEESYRLGWEESPEVITMDPFIPPTGVAVVWFLLVASRFENQRWVRARNAGMRGANETSGIFVDLTCLIGALFCLAFLVAYAIGQGWRPALGLLVIGGAGGLATAFLSGDRFMVWLVCTLAVWPLMGVLAWMSWPML